VSCCIIYNRFVVRFIRRKYVRNRPVSIQCRSTGFISYLLQNNAKIQFLFPCEERNAAPGRHQSRKIQRCRTQVPQQHHEVPHICENVPACPDLCKKISTGARCVIAQNRTIKASSLDGSLVQVTSPPFEVATRPPMSN
jgi:hypothetical protein